MMGFLALALYNLKYNLLTYNFYYYLKSENLYITKLNISN